MNWNITYKSVGDSAMDEVKGLARQGVPEGAVVCLERQAKGRGRQGRAWSSPAGGLYAAFLLKPDWPLSDIPKITLLTSVAVCETVRQYSGEDARIKWPNDILVDGEKLAGILTESEISGKRLDFAVVGIGLNANTKEEELPPEAVSLQEISSQEYDLKAILEEILERVLFWYEDVALHGFGRMMNHWKRLCVTLERQVEFEEAGNVYEGTAVDIDEDGGLLIRLDNGEVVKKVAGEIKIL